MEYILSFDVGVINLAYCLIDNNQKILLWNVVNISHSTYEGRCSKLVSELDNIDLNFNNSGNKVPITVIIERQMSKNRVMMIISGQILMYYTLKKKDNIKKAIYYSPIYKLKCYTFEEGDEPLKEIRAKPNSYAYRKNLSKQHCERMIKRNQSEEMIEFYKKLKAKKDDASDAFLQAVAYQTFKQKPNKNVDKLKDNENHQVLSESKS